MTLDGVRIEDLPEVLAALDADQRARVERLFDIDRSTGTLHAPHTMHDWIEGRFGSVAAVAQQTITRTFNRWTLEGALFNDLRARRPVDVAARPPAASDPETCPFCRPERSTPADPFDRINGALTITASNVAKYDSMHSMVILDTHEPLGWTEAHVIDAFATARRWLDEAHAREPGALHPLLTWNSLPRAGASALHPHMHMALGRRPYATVERWRRAGVAYRAAHASGYFRDLYDAHDALGLAGARVEHTGWFAHLTPVKERELVVLSVRFDDALAHRTYRLLSFLRDELGVQAFNVAVYLRARDRSGDGWDRFPTIVRIVDRGDPNAATNDIGAMELLAQPVIASDPWLLAAQARAKGC